MGAYAGIQAHVDGLSRLTIAPAIDARKSHRRQRNAPATGGLWSLGLEMKSAACRHRAWGAYEAAARWQCLAERYRWGSCAKRGRSLTDVRAAHRLTVWDALTHASSAHTLMHCGNVW